MKHTRERFQAGSLRKVSRKVGWVWEYRYRDHSQPASHMRQLTLSSALYPTESKALASVQALTLKVNGSEKYTQKKQATMATLVDRFIDTERLLQVKAVRPGEAPIEDAVQYSTACSYLTILNRYIRPRWGACAITEVKPSDVDEWLKSLQRSSVGKLAVPSDAPALSPKTKGHIKSLLHRLMEKAMFWDLLPLARNPIALVEVRGVSKRRKKPFILSAEQFTAVAAELIDPYRQMAQVAMCLGLRASEVLALRWSNFDNLTLEVAHGVVHGRVNKVKTECSEDELPLDSDFAELMQDWKARCQKSPRDWVFANPSTGEPYHASPIQQDFISAAGRLVGLKTSIGWHTFRHTYRSFLDEVGAPVGVQQKPMRHAQVATTMNTYGNAQMHSKRSANSKVVQMLLPERRGLGVAS